MKTKAWRKIFAMGMVATVFAAGCVITDDDDDDGDDGFGGFGGSAGTAGTGGSSGSGGNAGTAGDAGRQTWTCNDLTEGDLGPGAYADAEDGDPYACQRCIRQNCCTEFLACANDDPACWDSEITCIQECISDYYEANDGIPAPTEVREACLAECAVGSTITDGTNQLYSCIEGRETATDASADSGALPGCASECFDTYLRDE